VTRHAGLTLVEILVAMSLMLVVLAGSTAFVARGRGAHRTSEAVAQLEEALDAAFAVLVDEIRLSGYLGLAPPMTPVAGASLIGNPEAAALAVSGACGNSLAHDLTSPMVAIDGAYAAAPGRPLGCRPSPAGRVMPSADTLVLRHGSAEATRPEAGRLQLETNLRSAALSAGGQAALGPDSRWHDLEAGVYYVSADSTGRNGWPSLRRKRLVGGARPAFQDEELVAGISDMQIELGLDADGDGDLAVDRWTIPGDPSQAGSARALRLTLEARSEVTEASQPGGNRRKRVTRIVELRNHRALP
jgi:type IV pilus assembly protein PilW